MLKISFDVRINGVYGGINMKYAGIDIGSTTAKAVVFDENKKDIIYMDIMPTGWNSKDTSMKILKDFEDKGIHEEDTVIVSTGYGRISVPFSDRKITEITCHARGAVHLSRMEDFTVIDIGGQDTKIISVEGGTVKDFIMNDKCSAGTGRFLEVISNSLGVTLEEMFHLASKGRKVEISAMCTVFAESEVISLVGRGTPREDIAAGVIDSIIRKVSGQALRHSTANNEYFLTGGFSGNEYIMKNLTEALSGHVGSDPDGRYAGAIGAALLGKEKSSEKEV